MTWTSEFSDYFAARAGRLRHVAYALCGDWHLAEDLVQQTFLQLCRHWRRLEPTTVDAYARRTLVNAYLSMRRKQGRELVTAHPPEPAAVPGIDVAARLDMRRALDTLPPRQRVLVVLRHLEDVSVAEAAEILGIAEGTVKSQTAHGLAKLRGALDSAPIVGDPE